MLASRYECEIAKEMPSQGKMLLFRECDLKKFTADRACIEEYVLFGDEMQKNLFVLEVELFSFFRAFETLQTKIDCSSLI